MKRWPKYKLGQVGVGSNIVQNHIGSPIWSLFAPIHMQSWPEWSAENYYFQFASNYINSFEVNIIHIKLEELCSYD